MCPFQVFAILSIVLNKAANKVQDRFVTIYGAEYVAFAYTRTGRTAYKDFPFAPFDCYDADVFNRRLRTVSRATRDRQFHLVRRFNPLKTFLNRNSQRG